MSERRCANKVCNVKLKPRDRKHCAACKHMRARDAVLDAVIGVTALLIIALVKHFL